MVVTAGAAEVLVTDVPESSFKLATAIGRVFAHESGREDEFVAERRRDPATGFQQSFQVRLGGLLKAEQGFASVASVSVAAGKRLDLAIHTPSSSCRTRTFLSGTIIRQMLTRRAAGVNRPAAIATIHLMVLPL